MDGDSTWYRYRCQLQRCTGMGMGTVMGTAICLYLYLSQYLYQSRHRCY